MAENNGVSLDVELLGWQQEVFNDPTRFKVVAAGRSDGLDRDVMRYLSVWRWWSGVTVYPNYPGADGAPVWPACGCSATCGGVAPPVRRAHSMRKAVCVYNRASDVHDKIRTNAVLHIN